MTEGQRGDIFKRQSELDAIRPSISFLVSVGKKSANLNIVDVKPKHRLLRMDVGAGPEEGYFPEYPHKIGQYSLPIYNSRRVEEILNQAGLVDQEFEVKSASLDMQLDPRVGDDFENNAVGEMLFIAKGKNGKGKYLGIVTNFFLKDGEVTNNLSQYAYWQSRLPWRSNELKAFGSSESTAFYGELATMLAANEDSQKTFK